MADSKPPIVVGISCHQQRDQVHQRQIAAGEARQWLQRGDHHQKDQCQPYQQDIQGDLVGRFLPSGALDQGDHPVQCRLPRVAADTHQQPVRHHARIAGDRRTVPSRLADDRSRLAGDGCFIDRRDSFDDFTVTRYELAGLHLHHITAAQAACRYDPITVAGPQACFQPLCARLEAVRPRLAAPFGQRFGKVGEQHGEPQADGNLRRHRAAHRRIRCKAQQRGEDGGYFHHQHDRRTNQLTRIEFEQSLPHGGLAERSERAGGGLRLGTAKCRLTNVHRNLPQ